MKKYKSKKYIFVDLDGTFVVNDLFQERLIYHSFVNPIRVLKVFIMEGIIGLKHLVFDNYNFTISKIVVNKNVLELVKHKKEAGYIVVLATASPQIYADYIVQTWSLFDLGYGSDNKINLKSKSKLNLILRIAGGAHFEYIGDSKADEIIFNSCSTYYKVIKRRPHEFTN